MATVICEGTGAATLHYSFIVMSLTSVDISTSLGHSMWVIYPRFDAVENCFVLNHLFPNRIVVHLSTSQGFLSFPLIFPKPTLLWGMIAGKPERLPHGQEKNGFFPVPVVVVSTHHHVAALFFK